MLARADGCGKSIPLRSGATLRRFHAGPPSRSVVPLQSVTLMPVLFLAIGLAAGLLSGLFGIGGGIIIVPALLLYGRMEPTTATGTSLTALLLPVGALGVWQYYRNGHVNIPAGLLIAAGLFLGAYFGARVGLALNPTTVKRAFAVFLVLVSARIWFSA